MNVIALDEVDSTQAAARDLLSRGVTLPFVVTAVTQSQGRGRGEHTWISASGGLWCTLAWPVSQPALVRQASVVAGLSIATVLNKTFQLDTSVKWPNDVLVRDKKICGILADMLIGDAESTLLLGIGVNVNNTLDQLLPHATSLAMELGRDVDLDEVLHRILDRVTADIAILGRQGFTPFAALLNSVLALRDQSVTVTFGNSQTSGRVRGIDDSGALLLEGTTGRISTVDAGDIRDS